MLNKPSKKSQVTPSLQKTQRHLARWHHVGHSKPGHMPNSLGNVLQHGTIWGAMQDQQNHEQS